MERVVEFEQDMSSFDLRQTGVLSLPGNNRRRGLDGLEEWWGIPLHQIALAI